MNKLKETMRQRAALGVLSRIPSPDIIEIYGRSGWDFVIIDTEHGPSGYETLLQQVRAAEAVGISPMVRVATSDAVLIMKAMDLGVVSIIVPHVDTPQAAQQAAEAVRYAPEGNRGTCPAVRASGYTAEDWPSFRERSNRDSLLMVIVEGREGIQNIERIVGTPGVDAVWVGLVDLAMSLGHGGEKDHPEVVEAARRTLRLCQERGVVFGINPTDKESARQWVEAGARWVCCGNEGSIFLQASRKRRQDWGKAVLGAPAVERP
ncbi:MAG: hypothetical protein HY684_00710 [Chloroflexi bacterium]|nr:hypothetical protein [Chloroflexota bacterium]